MAQRTSRSPPCKPHSSHHAGTARCPRTCAATSASNTFGALAPSASSPVFAPSRPTTIAPRGL
eukprot:4701916-Pyramimonas_sp.AAC.1